VARVNADEPAASKKRRAPQRKKQKTEVQGDIERYREI
jgi:hypothetical protein